MVLSTLLLGSVTMALHLDGSLERIKERKRPKKKMGRPIKTVRMLREAKEKVKKVILRIKSRTSRRDRGLKGVWRAKVLKKDFLRSMAT